MHAACDSKSAIYVVGVLARGIELNERFKRSVSSDDEDAYRSLRKQAEQYDEEIAMPCVRRAQKLLSNRFDQALMHGLMDFAVAHKNSADETVSAAMAAVFAVQPDDVQRVWKKFPQAQRQVLSRSIESGWTAQSRALPLIQRQDREARLRLMLRESQTKQDSGVKS